MQVCLGVCDLLMERVIMKGMKGLKIMPIKKRVAFHSSTGSREEFLQQEY